MCENASAPKLGILHLTGLGAGCILRCLHALMMDDAVAVLVECAPLQDRSMPNLRWCKAQ